MDRATETVQELGIEADVIKIKEIETISHYGVLSLPALVVDGVVKMTGRLPSKEEIKKSLQ